MFSAFAVEMCPMARSDSSALLKKINSPLIKFRSHFTPRDETIIETNCVLLHLELEPDHDVLFFFLRNTSVVYSNDESM